MGSSTRASGPTVAISSPTVTLGNSGYSFNGTSQDSGGVQAVNCFIRRDSFFVGPFEFVLVDVVQLLVIIQALYIIGGYDRKTEMRGLGSRST